MSQYGGVDIGKHKSYACHIDLAKKVIKFPDMALGNDAIRDWFNSNPVKSICIDGPPQPNQGLLKKQLPPKSSYDSNRRIAEFRLLIYGCYGTPDNKPDGNWMANSMDLFGLLRDSFNWTIDYGVGSGELLETHPTYAFKSLIGCESGNRYGDIQQIVVDPKRLLGPKRPRNAGGHSQRIDLLTQCFAQLNFEIPKRTESKWESSIDYVDATMCALVALWRDERLNNMLAVGDPIEGAIYIPQHEHPIVVASLAPVEYAPKVVKPASSRSKIEPPNAIIMSLGANGPGGLSQEETIELAIHACQEGNAWLPIGTSHQFKLVDHLGAVGGQLYLAFGSTLCLRVTTGKIDYRPGKNAVAYPGEFNPWPVSECNGWAEMLDVSPVEITSFKTVQRDEWTEGFSKRGGNLLHARIAK